MMSCSTSKSWCLEKTTEAAREGRRLSTRATATRRMSTLALLALFLLLVPSGLSWPQMVASAPTPQHNDEISVVASAGRKDDGSLILNGNSTHQLRHGEPAEPPDIRTRDQRQNPVDYNQPLVMMDNINHMFSTLLGDSSSTASPILARTMTHTRSDDQEEDERNLVFNMVIQKERTEKSAFIAPDVNWLRDLVPKVVDVVDKPETTIKEIISNAMSDENAMEAEPMRNRQLFVNVVKSQIGSENDVPLILASLANLMKTGGPEVESKLLESRDIGEPQTRIYVINIIIFNLVVLEAPVDKPILVTDKVSNIAADITEDSYIVALKESQKNRFGSPGSLSSGRNKRPVSSQQQQHPRTPDKGVEEDSYIVALKESQKDRFKGTPVPAGHHHHHHHAIDKGATNQQQLGGQFFTAVPTYDYVSTARPLMVMEKDYLRRQTLKPAQQPLAEAVDEEEPLTDEEEQLYDEPPQHQPTTQSTVIVDPYGSLEFVNLPTGPYFTKPNYAQIVNAETTTSSIEKPPEIEAVVADVAVGTGGVHQALATTTTAKPVVNKKPLIVRVPEAVGVMTNKATNVVRNRIRTVGMLGIPMMVGLAGTVNSWLPAVAAFGRRRRRRSITEEEEENDWEVDKNNNREMSSDDDRSRTTIGNTQLLARLMGKGAESLLDSWKNREQGKTRSAIELPAQSTADTNKSAKKTRRPLWFRRLPAVKGSRTSKKMRNFLSTSRKYVTPLIYATFFGNEKPDADNRNSAADDDVMEHREDTATIDPETNEAVVEYDLEQQEVLPSIDSAAVDPAPTDDDNQPEEMEMEEEEKSEEEIPSTGPSFLSQSGSDFDIVSNFVRAMMMNHQKENEDDDLAENREEIFWVKEASIVNTTQTVNHKHSSSSKQPNKPGSGSSLLLLKPGVWVPSSGLTNKNVSLFSASSINNQKPIWNNNNNENVTNSPITYVSIKSPTKVTWLGVGPPDAITSTSPSSAEYDDPVEVMDTIDLPPSEIVGAPLEFYDEETDNYVSKEVPSLPGQPTVPYYITDRPPSTAEPPTLPLDDPADMPKPVRPIVMRPTDLRPGLSSLLLTIASFNRPRLPPPIDVSSSVSSQDQEIVTQASDEFRDDTTIPYTHGHGIVTQSDDTLKYTHGHGIIVTNPPPYDSNQLTAESSLLSSDSFLNQNLLPGLIKVTTGSQSDDETDETEESPSLLGDTSIQFVGMYGGTVVNSTNGPLPMIEIPEADGMESSLDDLITQLKANLTTGLMTDRPAGGLHFVNTSTDIVIINPFVTPSSMFPPPQVEAVEAEEGDTFGAIEDDAAIVVDAVAGNQPDSVPVVSDLANLFFGSSGGGSSSSGSLVTNGGLSSGGISGGTVSSTTTNPLALLYTYGLAAIGIFALTLPIWVPFVIGKKRRRTYAPSKSYPASKKKTPTSPKKTYGEPPPNHYKDLSEEEIYGNDHYLDQHHLATIHQQTQPQYQTTTIDDYFRPSEELRHSDYSLPKSDDNYIFKDSIALNPQDDMFNHPGPLSSEALYGSPARIFLKARRRRSARFRPSNDKRSND